MNRGLLLYCVQYILRCDLQAPQTALWARVAGYKPGTGGLEAGTLTTRPPHIHQLMYLFDFPYVWKVHGVLF